MKKNLPYILLCLLVIVAGVLIFGSTHEKEIDKRVTLTKNYKSPYGTYVAHELLPKMFPGSIMETNKKAPEHWYTLENNGSTLFFVISQHFDPNEEEILLLNRFVTNGNNVFIVAPKFGKVAQRFFGLDVNTSNYFYGGYADSPNVLLKKPLFKEDTTYTYPGFSFSSDYSNFDRAKFHILGTDERGMPNFIKASIGRGSFYLHSDPFLFSNYFILYKNNKDYFEKSLSDITASTKKIIWDEYYIYRLEDDQKASNPSPLRVLLSIPAFKWAFWLAIVLLALYLLLNMKRNQRIIPVLSKPKNESLDFAKVIGRLYFDKQDHLNLSQKMVTYFLEHIRSKYLINTATLNDEFVKKLSGKSGYDEQEIQKIIESIFIIQTTANISQQQLSGFYQQFQKFYKHTA